MTARLAAAVALALLAVSGTASAQGFGPEWNRMVAAAKQEGELVMVIPPGAAVRDFLAHQWAKAYPEIKLSMSSIPGPQLMPKLKLERDAGKYLWDVVMTGSENGFRMRDAGYADPVVPELVLPDVKDPKTWGGWEAAFMDREHKYVFATRSNLKLPYFNAKLLDPDKVKRLGTKIFLDPELKGKVIWHDPALPGSGRTFAPVMLRVLGEDGLRKFVTEQAVLTPNQSEVVERMVRGQFLVGMGPIVTGLLEPFTKAGIALDIRALGNTPEYGAYLNSGGSNTLVVANRPHPNATRLFMNWHLSKDVATALSKVSGEDSRRVDIPEQALPDERKVPGVTYWEAQREEYAEEVKHAQELIKKFRGTP